MNIGYIWYDPVERITVEKLLQVERPSWRLKCMSESQVTDLENIVSLLKSNYDAIMLHLAKPMCVALKMAELMHYSKSHTHVLLFSRTDADPLAISTLFTGHIHPGRDIPNLSNKIDEIVAKPISYIQNIRSIEKTIVRILNTDSVFQHQFRQKFQVLYRNPFTIEDYHSFANACLTI